MAFLIYSSSKGLRPIQNWMLSKWICWLTWLTSPELGLQKAPEAWKRQRRWHQEGAHPGQANSRWKPDWLFTVFLRLSYLLRLYNWLQLESNTIKFKGINYPLPNETPHLCDHSETFSYSLHYTGSVGWTQWTPKIKNLPSSTSSYYLPVYKVSSQIIQSCCMREMGQYAVCAAIKHWERQWAHTHHPADFYKPSAQ